MAKAEVKLKGKVVAGDFGTGSKSAHTALHIQTDKGSFVLRRKGGNPFNDPTLQKLAGKTVTVTGTINDYLFMARDVKEEEE